jgi:hypothetical protein
MNNPILTRGGADEKPRRLFNRRAFIVSLAAPPAIPAAVHVASASPTVARVLRVGGAFLLTMVVALAFAAISAAQAEADSRIRSGSCDVYAEKVMDPIALAPHIHDFFMGTVLSNSNTGFDLEARAQTSCSSPNSQWATSGGWAPRAKDMSMTKMTVYYRDPGDFRVNPIPTDLSMLNKEIVFNSQGQSHLVTAHFGNCLAVNASGKPVLDSSDHKSHVEDKNSQRCDASHPYRIPRASYLIHFPKAFTPSTPISMGNGMWGPAGTYFHADYLAAVQKEFNFATDRDRDGRVENNDNERALIDLCLNDVPNSVAVADPRCGPEPGN